MRETGRYGVEAYLKKRVLEAGGTARKWVSPGHIGVPDQIVIWPIKMGAKLVVPMYHLIETKAPLGRVKSHQVREHKRLRKLGCTVLVLNTKEAVDAYVHTNDEMMHFEAGWRGGK